MNSVVSEMRTVKGIGIGERAVMGRIKNIKGERLEESREVDDNEVFSRAQGIAISRIEESYEVFRIKTEFAEIVSKLLEMLVIVRSRDFYTAIKDITDAGITLFDAISHIERESENDLVMREVCRVFARILNGISGVELCDAEECIAVSSEKMDITELSGIVCSKISALVCVGESDSLFAKGVQLLGISALFVCEEDICACAENTTAILYPLRNTLYLSPQIEIVDDFTSTLKAEYREVNLNRVLGFFCGERIYRVTDLRSGAESGFAIEMPTGEYDSFDLYRSIAEISDGKRVTVLIRDIKNLYDSLMGIYRAAVYGNLSVAVSLKTSEDYIRLCEIFDEVGGELSGEKREFECGIARGIIIDNIYGALLAEKFCRNADFIFIDTAFILDSVRNEDKREILISFIEAIVGKVSVKNIFILGDFALASSALEVLKSDVKCFLAEK